MFLFHPWLPNAMERPTPVSSLLHSSTIVVAGVYLILRLLLELRVGYGLIFVVGLITSLLRGLIAMHQVDIKKIIAYSTTSQLRFMIFSLRLRYQQITMLYLVSHAFFKAMIFMVSGVFIHRRVNNQDVRLLGVSGLVSKFSFLLLVLRSVVIIRFPYFTAFWAKDVIVEGICGRVINRGLFLITVISLVLTSVYSIRMLFILTSFFGVRRGKVLGIERFGNIIGYFRLVLISVLARFFMRFFYFPWGEAESLRILKLIPMGFILVGLFISILLTSLKYNKHYFVNYLLYYNPLLHKVLGIGLFTTSKVYMYLDLVLLEYLLPRGVSGFIIGDF